MRVRLVTEGNYPVVRGGVTRWCESLIEGLPHHEWSVTALGVGDGPSAPTTAVVERIAPDELCPPVARFGPASTLPADVAALLFARSPDPAALGAALAACAADPGLGRALPSRATRARIGRAVAAVAGEERTVDLVDLAVERTIEVVSAARSATAAVDVHLVAAAGVAVVPAAVARWRAGTPFVLVEHGVYVREAYLRTAGRDSTPALRFVVRRSTLNLARLGYHLAEQVVGVTEANRRWSIALGADPARTDVVHNGVVLPAHRPALPGTSTVGMVGRIDPFKGVDSFVRAAAIVAAVAPDARFVHVGPIEPAHDDYFVDCTDLVASLGLGDRFRFVGEVADVHEQLAEMDVVVLPSRTEGLPYALLEAMAAGRPVIASAVGGVPEVIGGTGVLVAPEDHGGVAAAVQALLADPDRSARVGAACAERVAGSYRLRDTLEGIDAALDRVRPRQAVPT